MFKGILLVAFTCLLPAAEPVDRVGLPRDYRTAFRKIRVSDRPDTKTTAIIYANAEGATVRPGEAGPYPYGSILINEAWSTVKDASGNVMMETDGHYKLDKLEKVHVMRKERGFGEAYGALRSGEWEYVSYAPDGQSYLTPPAEAAEKCSNCHRQFATAQRDWVFGRYEKH
jgi:hypothetical protein